MPSFPTAPIFLVTTRNREPSTGLDWSNSRRQVLDIVVVLYVQGSRLSLPASTAFHTYSLTQKPSTGNQAPTKHFQPIKRAHERLCTEKYLDKCKSLAPTSCYRRSLLLASLAYGTRFLSPSSPSSPSTPAVIKARELANLPRLASNSLFVRFSPFAAPKPSSLPLPFPHGLIIVLVVATLQSPVSPK